MQFSVCQIWMFLIKNVNLASQEHESLQLLDTCTQCLFDEPQLLHLQYSPISTAGGWDLVCVAYLVLMRAHIRCRCRRLGVCSRQIPQECDVR